MQKKMFIVHQHDIKDCGACCLQSIIQYYNGYVSIEKIREDTFTTKAGCSIYHLKYAAEKYGFDAVCKKYSKDQILNIKLPAIVHVTYENGLNHFLCLYEIKKNKMILMDPAKGKVVINCDEFSKQFTGACLELAPRSQIIFLEKNNNMYNLFINIIKNNKKLCINTVLSCCFFNIFTVVYNLYFKIRYEYYLTNKYHVSVKFIIYLFLVILILKLVYEYFKDYYINHLNKNIDAVIYKDFLKHIFCLPLKVIQSRTSGEIITRVNEICDIKDFFSQIFISLFLDSSLFLCSLIILFFINKNLTFILLLTILLYVVICLIFNPYLYRRVRKNIDYQTDMNSTLIQNIDMIESIKNLDKVDNVLEKIEDKVSAFLYDNFTFINRINILNINKNTIIEIGIFITNSYGFYLMSNNQITLVDLVLFNTIIYYLIEPVKNVVSIFLKYNMLKATFNKLCEFIDIEEENIGKSQLFENGDIVFENIEYSYNNYFNVLNNLNIVIKKGDKVMLKGVSGSGKSTICHLLERYIEPDKGKILINNKNILDYSIKTIRENIIYVGQHENLYTDTIKNNITFYQNDDVLFNKICKICYIENIVNKKSLRYETGIDNECTNISGGEKQRIALARALMTNRDILIIDEALSETDMNLEKNIITNIIKEFPNKTIIYISHKNQDNCFDYIINLKELMS